MSEELEFSLKDLELMNRLVITVLQNDNTFDSWHNAVKTFKKAVRKEVKSTEELKAEDVDTILHSTSEEKNVITDIFIRLVKGIYYEKEGRKKYLYGVFSIELLKRWKIKLGLKAISPKLMKKAGYNSITIDIVRNVLKDDVKHYLKYWDAKYCASGYNWFFLCHREEGVFQEEKTRYAIPTPVIGVWGSKKKYSRRPEKYYQLNCTELLGMLKLKSYENKEDN